MSSAVKVWLPISAVSPTRMSSKNFMAAVPREPERASANIGLTIRVISRSLGRVEDLEPELDEAQVGPAARGARLEHGRAHRDPFAGAQRREPLHLLHAGRAHEARVDEQVVRQHAHQDAAAVPARSDQAAKQRRTRGLLVEVHRLRIEFGGEGDDLGAGDDAANRNR